MQAYLQHCLKTTHKLTQTLRKETWSAGETWNVGNDNENYGLPNSHKVMWCKSKTAAQTIVFPKTQKPHLFTLKIPECVLPTSGPTRHTSYSQ